MATPSTTPAPTLPADWAPSENGCFRSDDYWIWDFGNTKSDARTVVGGPSQTTNCFASAWDPTVTFAGSACPPEFTSACDNGAPSRVVTCCPTAHDFACQPQTAGRTSNHYLWFRCVSQYASQETFTVIRTDFEENTISTGKRTAHKFEHLFALALMYTTPPTTIPSETSSLPTTTTTSSPSSSSSSSSGLSPGAAAGIGVGAALAVFLAALLGWFLYRRRKRGDNNGAKKKKKPSSSSYNGPVEFASHHGSLPPITSISPPVDMSSAPSPHTHSMAHSAATTTPSQGLYISEDSRASSGVPPISPPPPPPPPKELPAGDGPLFELEGDSNPRRGAVSWNQ